MKRLLIASALVVAAGFGAVTIASQKSANAMSGDREKAIAAGCDDFDTKPVDLQRLLGKIRTLAPTGHGS